MGWDTPIETPVGGRILSLYNPESGLRWVDELEAVEKLEREQKGEIDVGDDGESEERDTAQSNKPSQSHLEDLSHSSASLLKPRVRLCRQMRLRIKHYF